MKTNKRNTKRALVLSVVSMLMCVSMLMGTTYTWFTDSVASERNKIVSGNLDVVLEYMTPNSQEWKEVDKDTVLFGEDSLWEPGHTEVVALRVRNAGTLSLKYDLATVVYEEVAGTNKAGEKFLLSDYLTLGHSAIQQDNIIGDILMGMMLGSRETAASLTNSGFGESIDNPNPVIAPGEAHVVAMAISMPTSVGNEANYMTGTEAPFISFGVTLVATQATLESDSFGYDYDKDAKVDTVDVWDGTADISWYDPSNPLTEYELDTAEQIAGLAELVSGDVTFKGVTIKLNADIDLFCEDTTPSADGDPLTFRPIGDHSKNGTFEGTFDGNGKTISNLYQNGWDLGYEWGSYGSYGLFGNLNNATVKNLTIAGAEIYIEGGDVGGITGSATGTCVFENITITDSTFATYNNGNGGIIGWSGDGNYTFKNITIAGDVVLAGLWGSYDSSIGGIVGQGEPGATYNFENVDIACRIDAYNDCTASYDYYNYRMCGMIIGRLEETTTIDGKNYPDTNKYNIKCTDVTVIYNNK